MSTTDPAPAARYNILDINEAITKRFGRPLKQLLFIAPQQIIDGCVVNLYDDEMKVTVASCRVRFGNKLEINTQSGDLSLAVSLSDLSFGNQVANLSAVVAGQVPPTKD